MITREVIAPGKSRRAEWLMAAFCGVTLAVLVAVKVGVEREHAASGASYVDGTYAIDPYSPAVTRNYSLDWYSVAPLAPSRLTMRGPVFHVGAAILGFDVDLPLKGEHHVAALCFDIDHTAPDDCLYFDEASPP